ncbi:hypothetical protein A0H81_06669 [Grifola frondosa]|uniref:Uncharacterized protein n=1 Tax=Grifola frondosa TaxID=5627 RepID=A0A1C7M943_GRIFR|nr:hypothetical protein A0H81_06669 [Grifola frondosa]
MPAFTTFFRLCTATAAVLALLPAVSASPKSNVFGALTPTSTMKHYDAGSLNPNNPVLNKLALSSREYLTNAKRMARGLPLNRPRFYNGESAGICILRGHAGLTDTRQASAPPRPARPLCPAPRATGTIRVEGDSLDGYISRIPNAFGEYGITTDESEALSVSITSCDEESFDIVTLNGIADFPYFGGVSGFANTSPDLLAGSTNYVYIAGTLQTPHDSVPVLQPNSFSYATGISEPSESALWTISDTNELTAQWINVNGDYSTSSSTHGSGPALRW